MQDWNKCAAGAWRIAFAGLVVAMLAGCAGTIKRDDAQSLPATTARVPGVVKVVARLSPEATKQQEDNRQFNRDELAANMRRRLEDKSLIGPTATHQVEITVTDIRVRSSVAAVLLGFMAGNDHVNGTVRLLDAAGKPVASFKVEASYAFGGLGGGQEALRMNWLYDKFSEMTVAELEKLVVAVKPADETPPAAVSSAPAPAAPAATAQR
ncbi:MULTISPECIES: DUF4410 domain-containing protein [unclassified Rhizobacter]|uniref:DUF4410 domain-containing protein n=1 Tax=unclassified Rhizobacter TaxID=2640088 RepID=UPI0007003135|nr:MULTISPECIES: DUF4410 domain-containing protein [unclassified Rhizobacter]KQU74973.1 hypothetical protein ASC88_26540 [Rhizobacter sp. Root29]KQW00952.1 hypothetical protein ASC98_06425 [Rhizobacter sp. Root1238]KRB03802.1 hypothetical protein ASE08_13930 [Rhizobacter sp. Root16D2]